MNTAAIATDLSDRHQWVRRGGFGGWDSRSEADEHCRVPWDGGVDRHVEGGDDEGLTSCSMARLPSLVIVSSAASDHLEPCNATDGDVGRDDDLKEGKGWRNPPFHPLPEATRRQGPDGLVAVVTEQDELLEGQH